MEPLTVTAGIIHRDDKILIAQRYADSVEGNKWEFPGGKLEPDETEEACLRREIDEELGLEIEVLRFYDANLHHYASKPRPINLRAYQARWVGGEITRRGCQDAKWISPQELTLYDFAAADIPIVDKLYKELTCPRT